jgi:hypothetical protein
MKPNLLHDNSIAGTTNHFLAEKSFDGKPPFQDFEDEKVSYLVPLQGGHPSREPLAVPAIESFLFYPSS